jgi:glycosyltransferase EpsF
MTRGKAPRVLHLVSVLDAGGIEKWLLSILGQVPRAEYSMDFCCTGRSPGQLTSIAQQNGASVLHCPAVPGHGSFPRRLCELFRKGEYDVIHNHLETFSAWPVWSARQVGVPVISSFHNTHFPPKTWTRVQGARQLRSVYAALSRSYALKKSSYVTGCSRAVLASLARTGGRRENWRVLYYGVDLPGRSSVAEQDALRQELQWPVESRIILHVGRMIEQKNHAGVLAVFRRVLSQVPSAKLLLVGDGPLRPRVESGIRAQGLTQSVRWLGLRTDVPELMSKCDLFLFPSRYEGFGIAPVEANAAGLPVVGSAIAGLDEGVADGETALLHPVDDVEGMAGSVVRLLTDAQWHRRLSDRGRERAQAQFSPRASAARLLEIYHECLGFS